jgi:hypothetical protein
VCGAVAAFALACSLFLGAYLAPGAQAAEGSGNITGKVTNVATGAPIAGIEVCAFPKALGEAAGGVETEEEGTEEELAKCPTTAANGEYTITGLSSGEYIVGFGVPFMSELNYVTQFYNGKTSFAEAQPVTVTAGGTLSGIDAKLAEGGRITGKVTDASTGAAIERAIVCAFGANPESGGCAYTNAGGEYTISGLVSGEYKVGFASPLQYVVQYYNDKAALSEAGAVSVLAGSTTSGVDAALVSRPPEPPPSTTSPTAPGTSTGPTKSTAPQPRVKVTSMGVFKPGRSGLLHVKLKCSGAPCRGSVELTTQVVSGHRVGARVVVGPEKLILAKGSFSLKAGRAASVVLRLTASGRRRLAHVGRHPLAVELALTVVGGGTTVLTANAR